MKSIYKYKLHPDIKSIIVPGGAEVLSAVARDNEIVVYAIVDTNDKTVKEVDYLVFGTGHILDESKLEGFKFLNTVVIADNGLIFHIFVEDLRT